MIDPNDTAMDLTAFPVPKPAKRKRNKYKARSRVQENRVAKRLTKVTGQPFDRVIMSGSVKSMPGDVRGADWLLELKDKGVTNARGKKQILISLDWLKQIAKEAEQEHKMPALVYQFTGDPTMFVLTPFTCWELILEELYRLRALTERMVA